MAEATLRMSEMSHPSLNDATKGNFNTIFKLLRTVTEFLQKTSAIQEQAGATILTTVEHFRRKSNEIKKERPHLNSLFSSWEILLAETEYQAQDVIQMASKVTKNVSVPLSELVTKHKNLSKKMFVFRDGLESQLQKADEMVVKQQKECSDAWMKLAKVQETEPEKATHQRTLCHNSHNNYLFHLQVLSSINSEIRTNTVKQILNDLQILQENITSSVSEAYIKHSAIIKESYLERIKHIEGTFGCFSSLDGELDISLFVRSAKVKPLSELTVRGFVPPDGKTEVSSDLVVDQFTEPVLKRRYLTLQKTCDSLKKYISKDEEALASLEAKNQNVSEFLSYGEELLLKRNELRSKKLQKIVSDAQKSIFTSEVLSKLGPFEKETCEETGEELGRKKSAGLESTQLLHLFSPNTFKKPTSCDYCKSLIKGFIKQGLRCRVCKMNIHIRCQENVSFCLGKPSLHTQASFHITQDDRTEVVPTRVAPPPPPSKIPPHSVMKTTNQDDDEDSLYYVKDLRGKEEEEEEEEEEDPYHIYADIALKDDPTPPRSPCEPPVPMPRIRMSMSNMTLAFPVDKTEEEVPVGWNDSYDTAGTVVPVCRSPPKYTQMQKKMTDNEVEMCVALFDYEGSKDDLFLSTGDIIRIIRKDESDWWEGKCQARRGFFPASYVKSLTGNETIYRCLFEFSSQGEDELSMDENEIVFLVRDEGNGWLYGKTESAEGAFPSSYVEKIYQPDPPETE